MFGRGCCHSPVSPPRGYSYIGPCRCGMGPHAFYQDQCGRVVHAWRFGAPPAMPAEDLRSELEALRQEKAELERRIEELERRLKEEK